LKESNSQLKDTSSKREGTRKIKPRGANKKMAQPTKGQRKQKGRNKEDKTQGGKQKDGQEKCREVMIRL
jgi:hypothetical protein